MPEPRRYIPQDSDFERVVHKLDLHGHKNIHTSVKYASVTLSGVMYVDLALGYFDEYANEFFYGQNIITFEEKELANRARQRMLLPKLPKTWNV